MEVARFSSANSIHYRGYPWIWQVCGNGVCFGLPLICFYYIFNLFQDGCGNFRTYFTFWPHNYLKINHGTFVSLKLVEHLPLVWLVVFRGLVDLVGAFFCSQQWLPVHILQGPIYYFYKNLIVTKDLNVECVM